MHGEGRHESNGQVYKGAYQNGKKHGYGVYTWEDGKEYAGNWQNGKQHGEGVYKGRKGVWENGKR